MFVLLLTSSITGFGSDSKTQLSNADSLFEVKKYTESFEVYSTVLQQGDYTPSMLLKMAFIKEGLGDFSGALYFLNQYYNQTFNKKTLAKIEEIAQENQLAGYEFDDSDFFINIYSQYQLQVLGLIIACSLLLFGLIIHQKRKTGRRPLVLGISYIFTLVLLFYLLNIGISLNKGIITDPQTYLMTGPSGGADVMGIIEKGHRVDVIGTEGVWVKIRWENQEVYIRDSKIRALS